MGYRLVATAAVLLIMLGCQTPSRTPDEFSGTIPGIDPNDAELIHELHELDTQINDLEKWLERHPAHFESEEERSAVHARWASAVERASILMNIDLENPELFARVGNLYRQGHNLDVPQAATAAYNTLSRCIALARDHVECHYHLARLLLASPPRFAGNAEQLLLRARSLIAPEMRLEFEAALARAYLAQGRRSAALRQIDYYLSLRPEDFEAQRFRNALINDAEAEAQREIFETRKHLR